MAENEPQKKVYFTCARPLVKEPRRGVMVVLRLEETPVTLHPTNLLVTSDLPAPQVEMSLKHTQMFKRM